MNNVELNNINLFTFLLKLLMSPDADERTKCKTRSIRLNHRHSDDLDSKIAIFDEKFSLLVFFVILTTTIM